MVCHIFYVLIPFQGVYHGLRLPGSQFPDYSVVGGMGIGNRGGFIKHPDCHGSIQCFDECAVTGTVQKDQIDIIGDGHAL